MAIKLDLLRYFCTVAQTGNLSDASRRLGRTQSAVSMALKQLEGQLGAPLFENERKNRLTRLGERVFALGSAQLRQFDDTVQAIEDSAKAPQGLLRIASVPSVAALIYPRLVRFLNDKYPGLRLELRDTDTQQVIDALVQGWADIGIASSRHALNGVHSVELFKDQFGLVCSANHSLAHQPGDVTIDDILNAGFLRNALCDQIETARFRDRLDAIYTTIHNTHSLLAMVRTGQWVTVMPRSVLDSAPQGLYFCNVTGLPDQRVVHLYQRDQIGGGPIAEYAYEFIQSQNWIS